MQRINGDCDLQSKNGRALKYADTHTHKKGTGVHGGKMNTETYADEQCGRKYDIDTEMIIIITIIIM